MRTSPALTSAGAAVFGVLLHAHTALAADGERTPLDLSQPDADAAPAAAASGGGLVRTIVGLAVVLAVIYGLHWVLKQVKASREERASGSGLAPLASLPLGPKGSLHLVRAGAEVVLVAAADAGVTPIRVYPEAEARALGLLPELDEAAAAAPAPASSPAAAAGPARLLEALRAKTVIR